MDFERTGLLRVITVALAGCGTPTPGATATAGPTTTTSATTTSVASSSDGTTSTTPATGGPSTSGSTTSQPFDCPDHQVFVCRLDTSSECGPQSECKDPYGRCDPSRCSDDCEKTCWQGWDCVDGGTTEMLVCSRDYDEHCDVWTNDCPEGTKCMPWADDGGNSWNAHKCAPLDPDPVGPGEVCTARSGVSGVDNCDVGSMCWDVDPKTSTGHCVPFCMGSAERPFCDPGLSCAINAAGVLSLCLPGCDPVLQDCAGGDLCLPLGQSFGCVLDASGDQGIYADPCEYANACDAGLLCLQAADVPKCEAEGCCSPFCDLGEPNTCPGSGQSCVPFFDPDQAPDVYEHVGYCGIAR